MSCNLHTTYTGQDVKVTDYDNSVQPNWCSGCGNFGIWTAVKRALTELQISPDEVLLCFDIGCNGNMSDKILGYRAHTLHGRVLPFAAAAKLANPKVKVIAFAGDGATYSEGIGHFINTLRNNYPITFIVHDNNTYGLTTGQVSATTPQCAPRTANPDGPTASTLNPLELALTLKPSFVAQGFSGEIPHLVGVLKEAIVAQDKGLSLVNVLQACPTYNKEHTHSWYQERVVDVDQKQGYSPADYNSALALAKEMNENALPIGKIYQAENQPSYLDRLEYRNEGIWKDSTPLQETIPQNVDALCEKFI